MFNCGITPFALRSRKGFSHKVASAGPSTLPLATASPGLLKFEVFAFKIAQSYKKDLIPFNGHIHFPKIISVA